MKKILMLAAVIVCMFQLNVLAEGRLGGRNFGLGVEFGDYPGVIAKAWVSDIHAFSMGVGFGPFTRIHVDYLWHDFSIFGVSDGRMPLYLGLGGIMNTNRGPGGNANFGVRGTFGVAYIFRENNFDIFCEVNPTYRFDPDNGVFLSGSVGIRYFFL